MSLNLVIKSTCVPIKPPMIIPLSPDEDFSQSPPYDIVLGILQRETSIDPKTIHKIKYRLSMAGHWKKIINKPILSEKLHPDCSIYIKVILKPCFAILKDELTQAIIERLQEENNKLKESFSAQLAKMQAEIEKLTHAVALRPIAQPHEMEERKDIIAFLYGVPLTRFNEKDRKMEALIEPIDILKEVNEIENIMKDCNKKVEFIVKAATRETIVDMIGRKSKVLHISCHGCCDITLNEGKDDYDKHYYLGIEDKEKPGVMDALNEIDIPIFNCKDSSNNNNRPDLVFLSACHSSVIGNLIKDAGIPNVIAVNASTKIAEDAATGFAAHFYRSLLEGKTIEEAFIDAKSKEKHALRRIKTCCRDHTHEKDCPYIELIRDKGPKYADEYIVPNCDCKYPGNTHKRTCEWAKRVAPENDVGPHYLQRIPTHLNFGKDKVVKICCCQPELPHDEIEKFVLITDSQESAKVAIFKNTQIGEPTIINPLNKRSVEELVENNFGREVDIQKLVYLIAKDYTTKIIRVIGPPGCGKTTVIRAAVKYVLMREGTSGYMSFGDNFETITFTDITRLEPMLNEKLLSYEHGEAKSHEELIKKIKNMSKIILLNCNEVMKSNPDGLINYLREITQQCAHIKFIIKSTKRNDASFITDADIQLRPNLGPLATYKFLKKRNPDWKITFAQFLEQKLCDILTNPALIEIAARYLRDPSGGFRSQDDVFELLKKEHYISSDTEQIAILYKSVEKTLNELNKYCGSLIPIYRLAQLITGIIEPIFDELITDCDKNYKTLLNQFRTENLSMNATPIIEKMVDERSHKDIYYLEEISRDYILKKYESENLIHKFFCIEKFATICRKIISSYVLKKSDCLDYKKFSAIVDDGIWASLEPNSNINFDLLNSNPEQTFRSIRENILSLINPEIFNRLFSDSLQHNEQTLKLLDIIKELSICTFTMMNLLGIKNDPENIYNTTIGFILNIRKTEDSKKPEISRKINILHGTMLMMQASLIVNSDKDVAINMADKADAFFKEANCISGQGEFSYLAGLFLIENTKGVEKPNTKFEQAERFFEESNCKISLARVNMAYAKFIFEKDGEQVMKAISLLSNSISIFQKYVLWKNMLAHCYYYRALCYKSTGEFELARQDLNNAIEIFQKIDNAYLNKCDKELVSIATNMQHSCPMFAFLKAFPLVDNSDLNNNDPKPLEPNIRLPSPFRKNLLDDFKLLDKCVQVHFNILNRKNFKEVLSRWCVVLHISSDHYEEGYMSFEDEKGSVDKVPLDKFEQEMGDVIKNSHCKIVIVAIPGARDIAEVFVNLNIPHVFYFDFSKGDFNKCYGRVNIRNLRYNSIYSFCSELYKNLLTDSNITLKEVATRAMEDTEKRIRDKGNSFGIENLHYIFDPGYIILPAEKSHEDVIFESLKPGNFIDTTPKRPQCDIEKPAEPCIGRQKDIYLIAQLLCKETSVNLYGEYGVGKTKLATEIGYFLYMRSQFNHNIFYIDLHDDTHKMQKKDLLKTKLPEKLQNRQHSNEGQITLVIIDYIGTQEWKAIKQYLFALKNSQNCVFLIVSHDQLNLENTPDEELPTLSESRSEYEILLQNYELLPFESKDLSIDYIMAKLEIAKYRKLNEVLELEDDAELNEIRFVLHSTKGFQQANMIPILLDKFVENILKSDNIKRIDLKNDSSLKPRYKKLIGLKDNALKPKNRKQPIKPKKTIDDLDQASMISPIVQQRPNANSVISNRNINMPRFSQFGISPQINAQLYEEERKKARSIPTIISKVPPNIIELQNEDSKKLQDSKYEKSEHDSENCSESNNSEDEQKTDELNEPISQEIIEESEEVLPNIEIEASENSEESIETEEIKKEEKTNQKSKTSRLSKAHKSSPQMTDKEIKLEEEKFPGLDQKISSITPVETDLDGNKKPLECYGTNNMLSSSLNVLSNTSLTATDLHLRKNKSEQKKISINNNKRGFGGKRGKKPTKKEQSKRRKHRDSDLSDPEKTEQKKEQSKGKKKTSKTGRHAKRYARSTKSKYYDYKNKSKNEENEEEEETQSNNDSPKKEIYKVKDKITEKDSTEEQDQLEEFHNNISEISSESEPEEEQKNNK